MATDQQIHQMNLTGEQMVLLRLAQETKEEVNLARAILGELEGKVREAQKEHNEAMTRHSAFSRALRATGLTAEELDILLDEESIIS
jgi:hypothetical protein